MGFEIVPGYDRPESIKALFADYMDMLIENDPVFRDYLALQNYDDELRDLSVKYGEPRGRLYLALSDGEAAGCIGMKYHDEHCCELKRLYVKPEFRGRGLALRLCRLIMSEAEKAGYDYILLDTLPFLTGAKHIYDKLGFYETGPYNDSPMGNSIYMRFDLKENCYEPEFTV